MKSINALIADYKKHKRYKKVFLLAWSKYLTYEELVKTDQLEVFDYYNYDTSDIDVWNRSLIEYNEDNVKRSLCIAYNKAINALNKNNIILASIYADDLASWLYILNDNDIHFYQTLKVNKLIEFFQKIASKYNFEFNERYYKTLSTNV